jgi:hypothetical protein
MGAASSTTSPMTMPLVAGGPPKSSALAAEAFSSRGRAARQACVKGRPQHASYVCFQGGSIAETRGSHSSNVTKRDRTCFRAASSPTTFTNHQSRKHFHFPASRNEESKTAKNMLTPSKASAPASFEAARQGWDLRKCLYPRTGMLQHRDNFGQVHNFVDLTQDQASSASSPETMHSSWHHQGL